MNVASLSELDMVGCEAACLVGACIICQAVLPFSKLNKMIFGYFAPENVFLDNKNNYFLG